MTKGVGFFSTLRKVHTVDQPQGTKSHWHILVTLVDQMRLSFPSFHQSNQKQRIWIDAKSLLHKSKKNVWSKNTKRYYETQRCFFFIKLYVPHYLQDVSPNQAFINRTKDQKSFTKRARNTFSTHTPNQQLSFLNAVLCFLGHSFENSLRSNKSNVQNCGCVLFLNCSHELEEM